MTKGDAEVREGRPLVGEAGAAAGGAEPLVSVIVPVYNTEEYLGSCVRSILAQTYTNLEVLLVDDGSTDGSGTLCDQLASSDSCVHVVHQANAGQAAARNYGIENCHGEYVLFCDSDDELEPNCIEVAAGALGSSGCNLLRYRYSAIDEAGLPTAYPYGDESTCPVGTISGADSVIALLDRKLENFVWCFLAKRSLYLESGIRFPVGRKFEDMAIYYQVLLAAGEVLFLPDRLYRYRQREGSTLHAVGVQTLLDKLWVLRQRSDYIERRAPELRDVCRAKTFSELPGLYVNMLYFRELPAERMVARQQIRGDIQLGQLSATEGITGTNRLLLVLIKLRIVDALAPLVRALRGNQRISDFVFGRM